MATAETKTELVAQKNNRLVVHDDGPASYLFDTARFEHLYRIASVMAHASLIPDHLRGKGQDAQQQTISNCMLVVNQAIRWQLDPFAVAPETYVVQNKLGFQGKLVVAVVNARAGLSGRLRFTFSGSGDDRTVTVSGTFADETEPRTITLSVRQAKTENKMWRTDPDQKLCYTGATKWARRHCPEIMLGVLTDDDLDTIRERSVAPAGKDVEAMLARLQPQVLPAPAQQATAPPVTVTDDDGTTEPPYDPPTAEETATEPAATSIEDDTLWIDGCRDALASAKTLIDLKAVRESATDPNATHISPAARATCADLCSKREAEIRGTRGPRSNTAK